jgi:hypothetical protein
MADLETMAILLPGVVVAHPRHQVNAASLQSAVGAPVLRYKDNGRGT